MPMWHLLFTTWFKISFAIQTLHDFSMPLTQIYLLCLDTKTFYKLPPPRCNFCILGDNTNTGFYNINIYIYMFRLLTFLEYLTILNHLLFCDTFYFYFII